MCDNTTGISRITTGNRNQTSAPKMPPFFRTEECAKRSQGYRVITLFFFPCVGLTCNTDISYEAGDSPYKVPPDWLIQDYEDHPKWCF